VNIPDFLKRWMAQHADEIERAVKDANPDHRGPWWAGMVDCWHCGAKHAAVIPILPSETQPTVAMECTKCGLMACYPSEEGRIESERA
jgi:hypothetical protein